MHNSGTTVIAEGMTSLVTGLGPFGRVPATAADRMLHGRCSYFGALLPKRGPTTVLASFPLGIFTVATMANVTI